MRKKLIILVISFTTLLLTRCEYLDEKPYDWAQPDDVFTDESNYMRPINQAYSYMKGGFDRISSSFLDAATDDGIGTVSGSSIYLLSSGFVTSSSPVEGCWDQSYKGIRQALFVQKNLAEQKLILTKKTELEVAIIKSVYSGEMYALRALYEFDLLRHYGGYPIIDKYYLFDDPEIAQKTRDSFEDCVISIVNICDSAIKYLDVEPSSGSYGRMSKGMAMAIKAKTLVYSASPLFNQPGNSNPLTGYAGITDADVKTRWEAAAAACAAVINLKKSTGTSKYVLYAAANAYEKLFVTCPNDEYIVFRAAPKSNDLENRQYPPSISNNSGGGTVPSQEFVDAFTNADGSDYVRGIPANQYTSRDPRLSVIVGYNGSTYGLRGKIYTKTGTGATLDALNSVDDKSTNTGYYLRKFLDTNVSFSVVPPATAFHLFPIIRLADIYLLYAEAMNEAYDGIDVDPKGYGLTAKGAIGKVRIRAGFPLATDKYLLGVTTRVQMREKIKNERRIELCFEEQRYFDLRRWMDGAKLAQPINGIRIEDNSGTLNYSYFEVDAQRKFDTKMYLHPIPLSEIKISTGLDQNPGW
ncbi:MAG: RagB/SusD family nutrient uptake outer membrane protein [Bacteroidia bacterium]|nr:RagB/SusD family nutrient uptake outer membrane protein [Bacteroidia bacterium]